MSLRMGLLLPAAILLSLVAGGKPATKKGEKIVAVKISSSSSSCPTLPFSLSPLLPSLPGPPANSWLPSSLPLTAPHLSHFTQASFSSPSSSFSQDPPPPVQNDYLHPCPDKKHFLTQGHLVVLSRSDRDHFYQFPSLQAVQSLCRGKSALQCRAQ